MALCRTAALGGHLEVCDGCGHTIPAYNSCRNRHCPSCQGGAAQQWVAERMERILPVPHFHAVFTVPAALRPLFRTDRERMYDLLLRSAARTLAAIATKKLGAVLGITAVLHTWNQDLLFHPHVHCIVTGGGLTRDGAWKATSPRFLFAVRWMSAFFRGAIVRALTALHEADELPEELCGASAFKRFKRDLYRQDWVVYVKRPFAGPEAVFGYLGRYTHRVGISDGRLLDIGDDTVTFTRRGREPTTVEGHEFLRRLLLHVLPPGFRKIRHYGLYAPAAVKTTLERARAAVIAGGFGATFAPAEVPESAAGEPPPDARTCPVCGVGHLHVVHIAATVGRRARSAPVPRDTS